MAKKSPLILALSLALSCLPLFAQDAECGSAEQATRETDILTDRQKFEDELREIPKKPPAPKIKEAPPAKEGEKFFVKKIELVGCEVVSRREFSAMAAKYENREVSLGELEVLAREIEREYLRRGIIAAVFVPVQEIKEGTAKLQVVEAKLGELNIQDSKYFNQQRLKYYWKIAKGAVLRYDLLSQSLQMMNKNPDREVKAALFAGKAPGTTDVLLTPQTRFPAHLTFSFDREGIPATGRQRFTYGFRHNNFLGLDDSFIAGYSTGRAFSGSYYYHTLPLNYEGTSILYGYSHSQSKSQKEYVGTGLKADAKTISTSLRQDIYHKDEYLGEAYLGFEAKDKTTRTNSGPLTRDRLRMVNLGANLLRRRTGNVTYLTSSYTQGLSALGAIGSNDPLASRGAEPVFSKFVMSLQHRRVLPFNLQGNAKLKGQFTTRKLTPQEEYGLGGIDSVRGYPASDYQADSAVNVNTELLMPANFLPAGWRLPYSKESLKDQTTLVGFVDYGYGMRRSALTTEKKEVTQLGMGAGVRFNLYNQALVRLEWGFPIGGNNPQTEGGKSQFHVAVDFQDRLPEEIERIKKLNDEEAVKKLAWQLVNQEISRPGSPLAKKLYNYRFLARQSYERGKLKESRLLYAQLRDLGQSLYRQAEDYVLGCQEQEKELKDYKKLAQAKEKASRPTEAKKLWQKLVEEARPQPLVFEF